MSPIASHDFKRSPPTQAVIVLTLCFAFVLLFTATPLYSGDQDQTDSLRKSVSALASARQTALQELKNKTMSAGEVADYKDFIAYLNTRIVNYCMDLAAQGGAVALEGLPCPKSPAMVGSSEKPPSDVNIFYTTESGFGEAKTQAEVTAELDGAFLASLGAFDDSLLKEEEKAAARVPSQRESGTSSASGATVGASDSSKGTGETGSEAKGNDKNQSGGATSESGREALAGAGQDTQVSSSPGASNRDHSRYGTPGGKLPPPEDDDIVARQLREAAEKEPDPELKAKLWEEYWKYKGKNKKGE